MRKFINCPGYGTSVNIGFLVNAARGTEVNPQLPEEIISLIGRFIDSAPKSVSVLNAATIIFHATKKHDERDKVLEKLRKLDPDATIDARKKLAL